MTVFLGGGVEEVLLSLPARVQAEASRFFALIARFPEMFGRRRRGMFKGYRYFVVGRYLFFYSVSSYEIRINAILPGRMRQV